VSNCPVFAWCGFGCTYIPLQTSIKDKKKRSTTSHHAAREVGIATRTPTTSRRSHVFAPICTVLRCHSIHAIRIRTTKKNAPEGITSNQTQKKNRKTQ